MPVQQFNFPTRIRFGEGAIEELDATLRDNQVKRPLIVTDRGLAQLEIIARITGLAKKSGAQPKVFSNFHGNPLESHVTEGVSDFKAHEADAIIMVGGGAALDMGKAIALMAYHPGHLFDYEDEKPGARPVDQKIPFVVAIPTTAGTGSEIGRSTVISDNETHAKKIMFSPRLMPPIVLADPELTYALPPHVTAATGIDAFTHCIEAFLAKGWHPICDGIALEGIRVIAKSLEQAVTQSTHKEARRHMLMASIMGGAAFQKGLGVNHSCAHALSTVYDLHHGLANGLMLDACMAFNLEKVPEKFAALATVVGIKETDDRKAGQAFLHWLKKFKEAIGLPSGLKKVDVKITDQLLDVALGDVCHGSNPRPVTRDDFRRLYEASL